MAYSYHTFALSRFKTLETKREKAIPMEDTIIRMVDAGFAHVLKIGKTLESILISSHRKTGPDTDFRPPDRPMISSARLPALDINMEIP